jgi:hypothetical protein
LKIAAEELRQQNRNFLRGKPLSAKQLADFISDAQKVQDDLKYKRLQNQMRKDREVMPMYYAIDGVTVGAGTTTQTLTVPGTNQAPGGDNTSGSSWNPDSIDVDSLGTFGELM